jgi:1-acyl-sn-glycerol-3-phosphate acyltransferase
MVDERATATPANGAALAAPPGRFDTAMFAVMKVGLVLASRIWFRLRVENTPRLAGAYVLAANHASFLDPLLVGIASERRIHFMMTEVVWRSPLLGWFFRWNRTIPVQVRGNNRDALRGARTVLQHGRVIGIFPEGGLSRDGGLLRGSPGAVSLVLNESVPIVPVGILGANRALPIGAVLPRPRRVTVRFGTPIMPAELTALAPLDRKARLQAATTLIMERIAELTGLTTREQQLQQLGH